MPNSCKTLITNQYRRSDGCVDLLQRHYSTRQRSCSSHDEYTQWWAQTFYF